jgi:adenine deaminase
MFNIPGRAHLYELTRVLVDAAMGREKADLVIRNASVVNVNSGEIVEHQDVATKKGRIALVGDAQGLIGPETLKIDASGKFLAPGFIDGHVHIESAMVTATEFAKTVLPHGTTTVFVDPHEITNVLGLKGVRFFLNESRYLPLKVLVTFPSCVPAAPGFETNGATIGPKEVRVAMNWEGVVALGEMMNYPGVLASNRDVHAEIAATLQTGYVVEGHAVDLLDRDLSAYAAAGITSCHESTKKIQAVQKLRNGIYAMLREASASRDVADTIRSVTEDKLDSRHVCLVTDDREPSDLIAEGHVDHVIRRAMQEGIDPIKAIQMATINVAEHYECARELGSIAPARFADIVILDNFDKLTVNRVIVDGKMIVQDGRLIAKFPKPHYPSSVKKSMRVKPRPTINSLVIRAKSTTGTVKARVIGVTPTNILTQHLEKDVPVTNNQALANPDEDVLKIAVYERHKATGNVGIGFVTGLQVKEGAVASTVGHDSHNLVVAGTNDKDMVYAASELIQAGGGMIAVKDRRTLAHIPLPIAGLMSDKPVEVVAEQIRHLREAWNKLGSSLPSPHITLAFTTLSVIPQLRITDKGLLDTVKFKFVNAIVE